MDRNPLAPLIGIFILLLLAALAVFGVGIYRAGTEQPDFTMLAAGSVCVVAVLIGAAFAWALSIIRARQDKHQSDLLQTVTDRLEAMSIILNLISEQQLLSDRAKSIAFREKDREALRGAILEEIGHQDWEAALSLANDIESTYGYRQEAERLRDEINAKRSGIVRKAVDEVVAVIDRYVRSEQWVNAQQEAAKLLTQYPDDDQVRRLPDEIESRRLAHKKQLLDSFHDAVARHDIDGEFEMLKQLDLYLTPQEAETLQETAKGVFREKLNKLRTRFTIASQDEKWAEAIQAGELIIRDFPNSKMAQEVRNVLDSLKRRAASAPVAATDN